MDPLVIDVFDALGYPMFRLPYTSCNWSDTINDPGSLNVDVTYTTTTMKVPKGLYNQLKLWGVILAAHRLDEQTNTEIVTHAGPLEDYNWDAPNRKLSLSCGGGWSALTKRLALNHSLDISWLDGDILIDEEHPAGAWALTLTGSYSDIMRGLVNESMQWGALPITLPTPEGGTQTITYNGYDLATVASLLDDLTKLADGNELRFDPRIQANGTLTFDMRSQPEINDHQWLEGTELGAWDSTVPGQRVVFAGVSGKGAAMTNQVFAIGGKSGDKTVVARVTQKNQPNILQSADKTHTTIVDLKQLRQYAQSGIAYGSYPDETFKVRVGDEYPVRPGDWADLKVEDDFMGEQLLKLKVTDVDGSDSNDWLDIQARLRG
ncbi:hypothetical protein [Bifidobacterium subtile]|jgi:phage-related protein|uniref:hypothetical protein n=1 Tax=Bifidobacterium subtile TaxID=77635 RepID=UPI002F35EF1E